MEWEHPDFYASRDMELIQAGDAIQEAMVGLLRAGRLTQEQREAALSDAQRTVLRHYDALIHALT